MRSPGGSGAAHLGQHPSAHTNPRGRSAALLQNQPRRASVLLAGSSPRASSPLHPHFPSLCPCTHSHLPAAPQNGEEPAAPHRPRHRAGLLSEHVPSAQGVGGSGCLQRVRSAALSPSFFFFFSFHFPLFPGAGFAVRVQVAASAWSGGRAAQWGDGLWVSGR